MSEAAFVPVVFLTGARAVGKSTIGYALFTRLNRTVAKSAYMDLAQLGFCRPVPADDPQHHRLKATVLAAGWRTFRDAGARHLVVTGVIGAQHDFDRYRWALGPVPVMVVRLDADPPALAERVALRARGAGPAIPGDELRGLGVSEQQAVIEQALRQVSAVAADLVLDTTALTVAEATSALFDQIAARASRTASSSSAIPRQPPL
ncbi:hypothetical protein ABIA35_001055 [Catenulispora sp. MAP12-49]|uniref:AAA family ATPase n=1 Tax=Catenulispora sp. MAP12-49 TaxID=3156302 RepID=UPI003519CBCC